MKILYFAIYLCLFASLGFSKPLYQGEFLTEKLSKEELPPLENRCRMILLRHGETDWNAMGKSQGWTDIPLNEEGRAQARELGGKLSLVDVKNVYASSLSRAAETAEIIASFHEGSTVIQDPALRFFRQGGIGKWFNFLKSKKRKQNEMAKEVMEDSIAYFKELSKKHPGETVIVVTHARVVKYAFVALSDVKRSKVSIKNGGILRIVGDGQTLSVER